MVTFLFRFYPPLWISFGEKFFYLCKTLKYFRERCFLKKYSYPQKINKSVHKSGSIVKKIKKTVNKGMVKAFLK